MPRKVDPKTVQLKIKRNKETLVKLKNALELHNKMINYRIDRMESDIKNDEALLNILEPEKKETRF